MLKRLLLLPFGIILYISWWFINPPFISSRPPIVYGGVKHYLSVTTWLHYFTNNSYEGEQFRTYLLQHNPFIFITYIIVFFLCVFIPLLFMNIKKAGFRDKIVAGAPVIKGNLRVKWEIFKLNNIFLRPFFYPFKKLPKYNGVHFTYYQRVPFDAERYHYLLLGSTGSGKTQTISRLLKDIIERAEDTKKKQGGYVSDKIIILDTKGDYTESFANPENTILLSPGDARTPSWSLGRDIPSELDIDLLLQALVEDTKDQFFANNARNVLRCVLTSLIRTQNTRNFTIENLCIALQKDNIYKAVSLFDDTNTIKGILLKEDGTLAEDSEMSRGILAVLHTIVPQLFVLKGLSTLEFSIHEFLTNPKYHRLILKRHPSQAMSFSMYARLIFGTISAQIAQMPDSSTRRIWLLLDELAVLGKFDPLTEFLERGRSKGVCVVAALQDWGSMEEFYKEAARSLFANFNSKTYLVQKEPKSAEYLEKTFGLNTIERRNITTNKNSVLSFSPAVSEQTQVQKESPVSSGDLLRMPQASKDGVYMYTVLAGYKDIFFYRAPILPFSSFISEKYPIFISSNKEINNRIFNNETNSENSLLNKEKEVEELSELPIIAENVSIHNNTQQIDKLGEYYKISLSERFHPPKAETTKFLKEVIGLSIKAVILPEVLLPEEIIIDATKFELNTIKNDIKREERKLQVPHA